MATHTHEVTKKIHDHIIGMFKSSWLNSILLTSSDDKIFELLTMLTPLEPLKRHQDVKLPRTKNTGIWLLELESFCRWRGSTAIGEIENGRVFCCYGIPGAGKTVLWYFVQPPIHLILTVR